MAHLAGAISETTQGSGEVQAHQWRKQALLRALLLLCTVAGMVLSSGAGWKWI